MSDREKRIDRIARRVIAKSESTPGRRVFIKCSQRARAICISRVCRTSLIEFSGRVREGYPIGRVPSTGGRVAQSGAAVFD